MRNGFLTCLVAKNRGNNLKWRLPSAMLAGIALLFPFQGFSRADDDDDRNATEIPDCQQVSYLISNRGRYFLNKDLNQCLGISITVSGVTLELRGHTIQGISQGLSPFAANMITADGMGTKLSDIEIAGPGTVTGGSVGIDFVNVDHSRVHNLVLVGNVDGIDVNASDPTIDATASTDNEFRDNVVAGNFFNGITVIGGNNNQFIHNNLSSNTADGLLLSIAKNNFVRQNTVDLNGLNGIEVGTLGSDNKIGGEESHDGNTALGNGWFDSTGVDLFDQNDNCTNLTNMPNIWTNNFFNFNFPSCVH
jgi:parallel beta-helix repeat protein